MRETAATGGERVAGDGSGQAAGDGHGAGACLNCGTTLVGAFCHACGQDAHVHRTLGSIGHDLLHGAFHFEGRIVRTLPLLARDPGGLTRRYVAGERVRFVSPLALFLFCVFAMVAVLHATGSESEPAAPPSATKLAAERARIDRQVAVQRTALAHAEALPASDPQRTRSVAALHASLASLEFARRMGGSDDVTGALAATIPDHATGWARLDRGIVRARSDPRLALYEFQANAYKYSWALIPISTPFVALLFLWRRRFTLYDHAIFVTYSLCAMLLLATALSLLAAAGLPSPLLVLALLVVAPVHLFRQLRGAYALGRMSAAWRSAALLVFACVALATFLALLLVMGLME